jgi:hypothetical protein
VAQFSCRRPRLSPATTGGYQPLPPANLVVAKRPRGLTRDNRHAAREWSDLDAEDKAANDADHSHAEGRLFSSYDTEDHGTIWVITEDLRSEGGGPITTVLFPEDY